MRVLNVFVNRETELTLIKEAVNTLVDKQRLLRTPIVEFYGIEGIGKTTLLKKIAEQCEQDRLNYFWMDGRNSLLSQLAQEARMLLRGKNPVVVIMDTVDSSNEERFHEIEITLSDLVESSQAFIILASTQLERFERSRSITRKIQPVLLKPFDRENCWKYLDTVATNLSTQTYETLFEWTRGYPLALKTLAEALVQNNLNIARPADQQRLISLLTEKVLLQTILARVHPSELSWYQTILSLLSVPRRFNLVMMQDIIEKYAPSLKLSSSLAYITRPKKISRETSVLSWSMERAGYSIDSSVRNLYLLKLRIEQPEEYRSIHAFLAEINYNFAQEVSGSDQVRYMREYFYHIASSGQLTADLYTIVERYIMQIMASKSEQNLVQFYEELLQDQELQQALGDANAAILLFLQGHLETIYHELFFAASGQDRWHYLRELLILSCYGRTTEAMIVTLDQLLHQIAQEESESFLEQMYHEIVEDQELKKQLGNDFDHLLSLFQPYLEKGKIENNE